MSDTLTVDLCSEQAQRLHALTCARTHSLQQLKEGFVGLGMPASKADSMVEALQILVVAEMTNIISGIKV